MRKNCQKNYSTNFHGKGHKIVQGDPKIREKSQQKLTDCKMTEE